MGNVSHNPTAQKRKEYYLSVVVTERHSVFFFFLLSILLFLCGESIKSILLKCNGCNMAF